MTPGLFGDFPEEISVYYSGTSEDKKTRHFFLADDTYTDYASPNNEMEWATKDEDESTSAPNITKLIKPTHAFEIHQGMVKHQITLHDGPNQDNKALALGGNEKSFRSTPILGMPRETEGPVGNKIVPIDQSSKSKNEIWTFASATSKSSSLESFQWRCVDDASPKQIDSPKDLIRLVPGPNLPEELVGTWTAEPAPISDDTAKRDSSLGQAPTKLGTFTFQGAGQDGELGASWRLMAVTSLLRMNQTRWEALNPVGSLEGMKMRTSRILVVGVEVGFGMLAASLG